MSWASTAAVRKSMIANRRVDTKPEKRLRSYIHRKGFRFRKDQRIDAAGLWVRPDVVFARDKVAVFVDGCFWHQCPDHATLPKRNSEFWLRKFRRNEERDKAVNAAMAAAGWTVVRCWEHEAPSEVFPRITRTSKST